MSNCSVYGKVLYSDETMESCIPIFTIVEIFTVNDHFIQDLYFVISRDYKP